MRLRDWIDLFSDSIWSDNRFQRNLLKIERSALYHNERGNGERKIILAMHPKGLQRARCLRAENKFDFFQYEAC